jgi:hypothetical protein
MHYTVTILRTIRQRTGCLVPPQGDHGSGIPVHSRRIACYNSARCVRLPYFSVPHRSLVGIKVDELLKRVVIQFTPTVPHCSFSTLIGLAIIRVIQSQFMVDPAWKLDVRVSPGSHLMETVLNKQFQDKERVSAALENPTVSEVITRCIGRLVD